MPQVERFRVNLQTEECIELCPIKGAEVLEDLHPAKIHIFCDAIDLGGQILFSGELDDLIVALDQTGKGNYHKQHDLSKGFSIGEGDALMVAKQESDVSFIFKYRPTSGGDVINYFHRERID